jgi:hypothetical protein
VYIGDLVCDAGGKATHGINLNVVGTTGNFKGEPDAMTRIDNVWIYGPTKDGIIYQGADAQDTFTTRVRVRQAGRIGYNILSRTTSSWPARRPRARPANTASLSATPTATSRPARPGTAEATAGTSRAAGTASSAVRRRDSKLHGWYIEYDKNTFNGCLADTAAMFDVGGVAGTSDGFYVVPAGLTTLTGCLAFDRRPTGKTRATTLRVQHPDRPQDAGLFVANTGWDNTAGTVHLR